MERSNSLDSGLPPLEVIIPWDAHSNATNFTMLPGPAPLSESDVALARGLPECDIPVPPRGYWAKYRAARGVTLTVEPLNSKKGQHEAGAKRPLVQGALVTTLVCQCT